MIKGKIVCRCGCNSGALTKGIISLLDNFKELLPRHYDLIITSGYRCLKHNSSLPLASPKSQHLVGNAIDCYCPDLDVLGFFAVCRHLDGFEKLGLGVYETEKGYYLHIDKRGYKARWHYSGGQKVPIDESWLFTL